MSVRVSMRHYDHIWASVYHVVRSSERPNARAAVPRSESRAETHVRNARAGRAEQESRDCERTQTFVVSCQQHSIEKRDSEQMLSHFPNV